MAADRPLCKGRGLCAMNHEPTAVSLLLTWKDTSGNSSGTTTASVALTSECQCGLSAGVLLRFDAGSGEEMEALVDRLMSAVCRALGQPTSVKPLPDSSSGS